MIDLFGLLIPLGIAIALWYCLRYFRKDKAVKKVPFNQDPERMARFNEEVKKGGITSKVSLIKNGSIESSFDADCMITSILMDCNTFDKNDPAEQTYEDINVAGITFHHYSDAEDGIIFGYAQREPTNPHDSNAIALYSWNRLKIGYFPRNKQYIFRSFTRQKTIPMTCIINTFFNDEDESTPSGEVTLYKGTEQALHDYLKDVYNQNDYLKLL